jgi:hypothetical protein
VFWDLPADATFFEGEGCAECGYTGYKGRTVIAEILPVDTDIAMALNNQCSENEIRAIGHQKGLPTMVDDGLQKLDETTLSEIIRVLPREMIKEHRSRQKRIDTLANSGPSIPRKDSSPGEVWTQSISPTHLQEELLDQMHQAYDRFKGSLEPSYRGSDGAVFKRFIRDSCQDVCQKYQCQTVTFTIELRDSQVDIFAKPSP